ADFNRKIVDLNTVRKPNLTIIDAYRILVNHGPTGGNLNDVQQPEIVIASADMVAADAYATTLFGKQPEQFPYLKYGTELGLGESDLKKISIIKA
ncbi:MAG: DUF362 domain-containing protein, partial [bacterium]